MKTNLACSLLLQQYSPFWAKTIVEEGLGAERELNLRRAQERGTMLRQDRGQKTRTGLRTAVQGRQRMPELKTDSLRWSPEGAADI